LTLH